MRTGTSHHLRRHTRAELEQPREPVERNLENGDVARRCHAEPDGLYAAAISDGERIGRGDSHARFARPRRELGARPRLRELEPPMISGTLGAPGPILKNAGCDRLPATRLVTIR